jgi:SH3-like domain-containing protein
MRRLAFLLGTCALLAACATPPQPPPPEAVKPPPAPPPLAAIPEPVCPVCVDRSDEIARLRQELAARDAELKELRASQREQVKAVQESTREVTRARARIRRLATQADAASYIAEIEVALEAARAAGPSAQSPWVGRWQGVREAAQAPFAQGDYGTAMDRAAQAEQLVAAAVETAPGTRSRVAGEVLLQVRIPLKARSESRLRREPAQAAAVVATLPKDTALVAHAYKDAWMRVETEDGRFGWLPQATLAAR